MNTTTIEYVVGTDAGYLGTLDGYHDGAISSCESLEGADRFDEYADADALRRKYQDEHGVADGKIWIEEVRTTVETMIIWGSKTSTRRKKMMLWTITNVDRMSTNTCGTSRSTSRRSW